MLDKINRYAHGFVAIPVILALKERGFFDLLYHQGPMTLDQMVESLEANGGHLQVALRMMQSMNWVSRNEVGEYSLRADAESHQEIPEDILDLFYLPIESYLMGEQHEDLLREWIERSRQRWNVTNPLIADFLDGILVIPVLLALEKNSLLGTPKNEQGLVLSEFSPPIREELNQLFVNQGWAYVKEGRLFFTAAGQFMVDRILILGTVASYKPMLSNVSDLLFGDPHAVFQRDALGSETHINRTLNVVGSGFQHEKYFADVDKIILSIFNQLPYEEQPKYIVDMGCGDGTLLKRVYETIQFKSVRGNVLDQYPICLIGVDYNEEALEVAARTLATAPYLLLRGDIGNPAQLMVDLKDWGIDPEHILHIRSFLDHDRPFVSSSNIASMNARSRLPYQGVYVDSHGQPIPPYVMVQSLVEHLERWACVSTKHGLIILEVHCLEPDVISTFLDKSESLHFDAYHAFSRQHLVEADVFLAAAAEVGLFPKSEFFRKYPNTFPFSRITLNWFEKRPYTIRHPHLDDLSALVNLEAKCWPEPLRVSSNEIQQRLKRFPDGHYVLEMDGRIVGVIYSQRISRVDLIENATFEDVNSLHSSQGSIIQLLGMNILPEMQDMALDDQILEFFLNWCALKGGIKGVVGVSWCKNYVFHPHVSIEEYLRKRKERGQFLDTILYFYGHHNPMRSAISAAQPEERQQLLEDYFREQIARVLEVPVSELNVHQRFIDLGLDSLMAMELEHLIKTDLGVVIPMVSFLQGPSIAQLVTDVLHSLNLVTGNGEAKDLGHAEEEFII